MGIINFWEKYYMNDLVVGNENPQKNIGRTKSGSPITGEVWKQSIQYIKSQIGLKITDDILEVCCGNGMVIGELSKYCNSAKGIDFSEKLINQLNENYPNVSSHLENVLDYNYKSKSYDKVLLYFSAQHFDETDLLELIQKMLYTTKKNGSILIGDIPDESEKWNYISEPNHKVDYFDRISEGEPMIGKWYSKDWFLALKHYLRNVDVEIIEQPDFMINSDWRFDVLIKKY